MNPSSNETSDLRLPPPVSEQLLPTGNVPESKDKGVEQTPAAPERAPRTAQTAAALPSIPLPSLPVPSTTITTDGVTATTQSTTLQTADDTDLIEKEWVNKAKQIVARTRDDPHQQSNQLTGVKADYMKKRYNKAIKLST